MTLSQRAGSHRRRCVYTMGAIRTCKTASRDRRSSRKLYLKRMVLGRKANIAKAQSSAPIARPSHRTKLATVHNSVRSNCRDITTAACACIAATDKCTRCAHPQPDADAAVGPWVGDDVCGVRVVRQHGPGHFVVQLSTSEVRLAKLASPQQVLLVAQRTGSNHVSANNHKERLDALSVQSYIQINTMMSFPIEFMVWEHMRRSNCNFVSRKLLHQSSNVRTSHSMKRPPESHLPVYTQKHTSAEHCYSSSLAHMRRARAGPGLPEERRERACVQQIACDADALRLL